MAKTQKAAPQQLQLRVFADVKGGSSNMPFPSSPGSQVCSAIDSRRDALDEATSRDREIYRAIAERYFRSES